MNKKRILMVHNFYQIGGGEHTVYKNEVEMLRENGHEVIEYTRSNDELKNSKLKLLLLPFTTIWSFKTYFEIKKIIKENKIDIVHCHNTFPLISPSVYYAAIGENIPVVQTIHNFRFLCPCGVFYRNGKICEECVEKKSFMPAIKYKCYRNSKIQTLVVAMMLSIHRKLGTYKKINYIFLTEFNKEKFSSLIDINGKNIFIKPNFVNTPLDLAHKNNKEKIFVFASRLEENKGIKFLIDQWEKMPKEYKLHIYGNGTLEKFVEKEVSQRENIKFYGFKSYSIIFEDLKNAVAMIFPSLWYEGFPMIIAESMSVGCPVISSNIGNEGDIVLKSKGGVVFNHKDKNGFKIAIEEVIENNLFYRKNAMKYYKEFLSKDKNYKKQSEIYQKTMYGGGTANNRIFIFVGRLDKGKGIIKLLDNWKKLPLNYQLYIYGDGECKKNVLEIAKLHENIIFYGFKSQDIILKSLKNSVALITPYIWYEGYPMTIAESFSIGVPVISTNYGNAGDIVKRANGGVCFSFEEKRPFIEILDDVYNNRKTYSKNALDYYYKNQTSKINYERLSDIYDKARII